MTNNDIIISAPPKKLNVDVDFIQKYIPTLRPKNAYKFKEIHKVIPRNKAFILGKLKELQIKNIVEKIKIGHDIYYRFKN